MRLIQLVFLVACCGLYSLAAMASLTANQKATVIGEVKKGNFNVLKNLRVDGLSLEAANIDTDALIKMVQAGNTSALSSSRLTYASAQDATGSAPAPKPSGQASGSTSSLAVLAAAMQEYYSSREGAVSCGAGWYLQQPIKVCRVSFVGEGGVKLRGTCQPSTTSSSRRFCGKSQSFCRQDDQPLAHFGDPRDIGSYSLAFCLSLNGSVQQDPHNLPNYDLPNSGRSPGGSSTPSFGFTCLNQDSNGTCSTWQDNRDDSMSRNSPQIGGTSCICTREDNSLPDSPCIQYTCN